MARHRKVDVLVLGAGPAGATAAGLLARAGIEAVLVDGGLPPSCEHVGELVVPGCLPLLRELGVADRVASLPGSVPARRVTFASPDGGRSTEVPLTDGHETTSGQGLVVDRRQLRACLHEHARGLGAELVAGKAVGVSWDGQRLAGLSVVSPEGQEHALYSKVLLDASGDSSFLATRMGWRFPYPKHRKAVIAVELGPSPAGHQDESPAIVVGAGGWSWVLPLSDGRASAGMVTGQPLGQASSQAPATLFWQAVSGAPELARRIAGRTQTGAVSWSTSCAFRVLTLAGDGYCLVGAAQGVLDPVVTSGLLSALATAASAAQDVIDCLLARGRMIGSDFGPTITLGRVLRRTNLTFLRAIDDPHSLALLLNLGELGDFRRSLSAMMSGDVLRPGLFRRALPLRVLLALGELQRLACALGRPLVAPVGPGPGQLSPASQPGASRSRS